MNYGIIATDRGSWLVQEGWIAWLSSGACRPDDRASDRYSREVLGRIGGARDSQ